ncbi:YihY/virulence factor BrkB family protein [Ramlibacter sp. AN1015]|uniref:YihY/virulence factor BrkB family protein n=1 Tax=Ramlibacter sp. AN1015 TaxID=3133428 RepID=UPI0030BC19D5
MPSFKLRASAWAQRMQSAAQPLWRAIELWNGAEGMRMSAAMSFYGVLSLAPLLLVVVALLGWWLDRALLEQTLVSQVGEIVGPRGAGLIREALSSAQSPEEGLLASLIGFAVLLFGATGVFGEMQEALHRLWAYGTDAPPATGWRRSVRLRLRGIGYVLAFGFLLLVSLVVSTVLKIFSGWAGRWIAVEVLLALMNELLAFGACAGLFVAMMRLSVGRRPQLRFIVLGALIGGLLFTLGRQLLAVYLSTAPIVSTYGAAGSLVVLLFWIYFSSAVLLFAACCARAAQEARRR